MSDKRYTEEQILDIIDEWHDAYGDDEPTVEIYDMLGWTPKEYSLYVETGYIPGPED
jgi:hypothetical protein